MYSNDDYTEEDEQEESGSGNKLLDFYNNNKKLVWLLVGILGFILILSLLTGGGSNNPNGQNNEPEKVIITYNGEEIEKEELAKGYSLKLVATVGGKNVGFTWTSSDEAVAKVDDYGLVRGLGIGTAVITATKDGEMASCTVTVYEGDINVSLTEVYFPEGILVIGNGKSASLDLTLKPAKAYIKSKEFTSSDETIATVDANGTIKALKVGKTTIKVNVNDSEFEDEIDVYVVDKDMAARIINDVNSINFQASVEKIKVGQVYKLVYDPDPIEADLSTLTWESSNTDCVTVDASGNVTAIKVGSALIKAYSITGKEVGSIVVQVETNIIDVTSITTSYTNITVNVGEQVTITPVVKPDDASNKALTFTSSDEGIAQVISNNGGISAIVYGKKAGTTVLTIKSDNGITTVVNITVTDPNGGYNPGGSGNGGGGNGGGEDLSSKTYTIRSSDANGNSGRLQYEMSTTSSYPATGPLSITFGFTDSKTNYLRVCHYKEGATECTANSGTKISSSSLSKVYQINQIGKWIIKVWEYDSNDNIRRGPDYWYTNITKVDSSVSDENACYVNVTSQGVGTGFTWIKASAKTSTQQKTTLSYSECLNAAAGQYCFKDSSGKYYWSRNYAIISGYTYVLSATKDDCESKNSGSGSGSGTIQSLTITGCSSGSTTFVKGNTGTFAVTASPLGASNSVTWSSSNSSVMPVLTQTGNFSALSVGSATVTATSTVNSNVKATCNVTVIDSTIIKQDVNFAISSNGSYQVSGNSIYSYVQSGLSAYKAKFNLTSPVAGTASVSPSNSAAITISGSSSQRVSAGGTVTFELLVYVNSNITINFVPDNTTNYNTTVKSYNVIKTDG